MKSIQETMLYFKSGSSDKAYQVSMEHDESTDKYFVSIAFGRRGSALKVSRKTPTGVTLDKAKAVFDKAVSDKTKKGYSPEEGALPFVGTENAGRSTGSLPMLLNSIDKAGLLKLAREEGALWGWQIKHDGERRMVRGSVDGTITGANRNGLTVPMSQNVVDELTKAFYDKGISSFHIDCECFGSDGIVIFDVLEMDGRNLKEQPLSVRGDILNEDVAPMFANSNLVYVEKLKWASEITAELIEENLSNGEEGLVIKNLMSTYTEGRPSKGGNALKFKHTDSLSAIVTQLHDSKASVRVSLWDKPESEGGQLVDCGSVTIPPNYKRPEIGAVVEVLYMNMIKGGSLYQPRYKGERNDIPASDCLLSQVRYKKDISVAERSESEQASVDQVAKMSGVG